MIFTLCDMTRALFTYLRQWSQASNGKDSHTKHKKTGKCSVADEHGSFPVKILSTSGNMDMPRMDELIDHFLILWVRYVTQMVLFAIVLTEVGLSVTPLINPYNQHSSLRSSPLGAHTDPNKALGIWMSLHGWDFQRRVCARSLDIWLNNEAWVVDSRGLGAGRCGRQIVPTRTVWEQMLPGNLSWLLPMTISWTLTSQWEESKGGNRFSDQGLGSLKEKLLQPQRTSYGLTSASPAQISCLSTP